MVPHVRDQKFGGCRRPLDNVRFIKVGAGGTVRIALNGMLSQSRTSIMQASSNIADRMTKNPARHLKVRLGALFSGCGEALSHDIHRTGDKASENQPLLLNHNRDGFSP